MPREPSYRKHSVENFGFYEYQKKRVRLPGEFNSPESLAAYYSFVAKWRASHGVLPPALPPPDQITIVDLCNQYVAFAEVHYEKGGKRGELQNAVAMVRHLVKHFAHEPAAQFGPKKLKALRDKMVGEAIVVRRKKKNPASPASPAAAKTLSRTYINSILARVKRLFRWAASEELITADLYLALETVPGLREGEGGARETEDRHPVGRRDRILTMRYGRLPRVVRDIVRLQRLTGVRSDSLCNATADQFDRSKIPWLWRPKHKGEYRGQELTIPIGPRARRVLSRWIDRATGRPGGFLFSPQSVRRDSRYGVRYTAQSYGNAIARAVVKANAAIAAAAAGAAAKNSHPSRKPGAAPARPEQPISPVAHWSPHQLRHALGQAVRERYGVEAAQAMLGHDSLDATQIYTTRQLAVALRVAEEIG